MVHFMMLSSGISINVWILKKKKSWMVNFVWLLNIGCTKIGPVMYCSWTYSCCLLCQCLDVVLSALESNFSFLFSLKDICRQSSSLHRIHLLWDCQVGDSVKQHNASSCYCQCFVIASWSSSLLSSISSMFSWSSFCLSNWCYQLILDSKLNSCILKIH